LNDLALLLRALAFSAEKHRNQRRKDVELSPYINHPIDVANVLANVGGVSEVTTLVAALLHDTLEDTRTTREELDAEFGPAVRRLVEEVTDDKSLPKAERKLRQIEHAPTLSNAGKQIKLGDKISNVRGVTDNPPAEWSTERRREYLDWTERVVSGCRGVNAQLERCYDEELTRGRAVLPRPE